MIRDFVNCIDLCNFIQHTYSPLKKNKIKYTSSKTKMQKQTTNIKL